MNIPDLEPNRKNISIYRKIIKVKYYKNVLKKKEQNKLKRIYGEDKLKNGLSDKWLSWIDKFSEVIAEGGFEEKDIFTLTKRQEELNIKTRIKDDEYNKKHPEPTEEQKLESLKKFYASLTPTEIKFEREMDAWATQTKSDEWCKKNHRGKYTPWPKEII